MHDVTTVELGRDCHDQAQASQRGLDDRPVRRQGEKVAVQTDEHLGALILLDEGDIEHRPLADLDGGSRASNTRITMPLSVATSPPPLTRQYSLAMRVELSITISTGPAAANLSSARSRPQSTMRRGSRSPTAPAAWRNVCREIRNILFVPST
jgi:hypothetical protein